MNTYRFDGDIRGTSVHIGDIRLTTYVGDPPRDSKAAGASLLDSSSYGEAVVWFREALADDPNDLETRYLLALSLLDGRRPHRHGPALLGEVERHLRAAIVLPQARALLLLVLEDADLLWRRRHVLPEHATRAIDQLEPALAARILRHVPARESLVWQAMGRRVEEE